MPVCQLVLVSRPLSSVRDNSQRAPCCPVCCSPGDRAFCSWCGQVQPTQRVPAVAGPDERDLCSGQLHPSSPIQPCRRGAVYGLGPGRPCALSAVRCDPVGAPGLHSRLDSIFCVHSTVSDRGCCRMYELPFSLSLSLLVTADSECFVRVECLRPERQ